MLDMSQLGATTNSNLQFSDVRFVNNSAQSELSSGGALSLEGLYLEVNFLEKLLFKDNTADSGGAITMDGVAAVNMNDVAFESNYARKGAGGAIQAKVSLGVFYFRKAHILSIDFFIFLVQC